VVLAELAKRRLCNQGIWSLLSVVDYCRLQIVRGGLARSKGPAPACAPYSGGLLRPARAAHERVVGRQAQLASRRELRGGGQGTARHRLVMHAADRAGHARPLHQR